MKRKANQHNAFMHDIKHLYAIFIGQQGLPTDSYRDFLLHLAKRIPCMTWEERDHTIRLLTRWEEEALTGIMTIHPTDPQYKPYHALLQAVFKKIPFEHADGSLDLANTTIVGILQEKDCAYGTLCKRVNPIHIQLFHHNVSDGKFDEHSIATQ